eukprot:1361208-Amorphochlora_amoeboformis.AAC.1
MATQPGKEAKPAGEASDIKKESVVVSSLPQPTPLKAPTEKKEPLPPSSSTSEIVKEVETKSKDSEGKGKTRMERKGEEKEGPTESKKSVKEVKFRSGEDMEDEERSLEPLFEDQKKFLKGRPHPSSERAATTLPFQNLLSEVLSLRCFSLC